MIARLQAMAKELKIIGPVRLLYRWMPAGLVSEIKREGIMRSTSTILCIRNLCRRHPLPTAVFLLLVLLSLPLSCGKSQAPSVAEPDATVDRPVATDRPRPSPIKPAVAAKPISASLGPTRPLTSANTTYEIIRDERRQLESSLNDLLTDLLPKLEAASCWKHTSSRCEISTK